MTQSTTTLRSKLSAEHASLDHLFDQVLRYAHEDDRESLMAVWRAFEMTLTDHLAWEERDLLPRYAVDHKADADAIATEHKRFRELMSEFGIALDLHLLREDMIQEMVDLLRRHARREDAQFYRWAEEHHHGLVETLLATLGREPANAPGAPPGR